MASEERERLTELRHRLLNGFGSTSGLFRKIEKELQAMSDALTKYEAGSAPREERRPARYACRCCGKNGIDARVVQLVEAMEAALGRTLQVTSAYRCEKHNTAVGGSPTSSHLAGRAVDIGCGTSRLRYLILNAAIRRGVHRIGIGKTFLHFDVDQDKDPRVAWMY